jgi:Flp pilus assembly protein TadG
MLKNGNRSMRLGHKRNRRVGAILSVEWLMVFPILVAVMFAITEFSLLWSAKHLLEAATYAAAREASLPATSETARRDATETAIERVLASPKYLAIDGSGYQFDEYTVGSNTGDPVRISLSLPMKTAAPDLLKVIGISIDGKRLTATTVMRRE